MKFHELKSWPDSFAALRRPVNPKRFEVRRDDRGFEAHDIVIFREFLPTEEAARDHEELYELPRGSVKPGYTGIHDGPFTIGYVERSSALPPGWCGFSLIALKPERES